MNLGDNGYPKDSFTLMMGICVKKKPLKFQG